MRRAILATCLALLLVHPRAHAESMHIFGVHSWSDGAQGDVMNGLTGWITEANLAREGPNVKRYERMAGQGFTLIQRLDWDWHEGTIPTNPADHDTFADDCARWARRIGHVCHHWLIGNEMEIANYGGNSNYVAVFQKARNAIRNEQPHAKVIIGVFTNGGNTADVVSRLGPDGYDGLSAHSNGPPTDMMAVLNNNNAPIETGVYITEFGWVGSTNPNAMGDMLGIYNAIGDWNRTHFRQVYCATWFVYDMPGWETFSLALHQNENRAFEAATALGTALNSYKNNRIYTSNVWVEIGPSVRFAAQWDTNVPASSQMYWRTPGQLLGQTSDRNSTPVTRHRREGDIVFHDTEHRLSLWSTGVGMADAADGPVRFLSGPLAVRVESVTDSQAVIAWETAHPFDSAVEYGETDAYGESVHDPALTTDHRVTLTDLAPGTTYHFRAVYGADGWAGHRSVDGTFTTQGSPGEGGWWLFR